MSGLLSATGIFITWQNPLLKSPKSECSCRSSGTHCICRYYDSMHTGVGKQFHTHATLLHNTGWTSEFQLRNTNKHTEIIHYIQSTPKVVITKTKQFIILQLLVWFTVYGKHHFVCEANWGKKMFNEPRRQKWGQMTDSKESIRRHILTYSRLERKNVW